MRRSYMTKGLQSPPMRARTWIKRLVVVATLGVATAGVLPPTLPTSPAVSADGMGAGGEFHPLTPERIHDTRKGINDLVRPGKKATSTSGSSYTVKIAGAGGVPADPADVLAVVLNVTVADPEARGNLGISPSGSAAGTSSLVNFLPGRNVPNLAIVGVGSDGKVSVKLTTVSPSRAHVIIDVFGWISKSGADVTAGARLIPVPPGRIADTRKSGGALGGGESLSVQMRGADASDPDVTDIVPARDTVSAVMVNITAVNRQNGSRATNVSATPVLQTSAATTSNTNVPAGAVKANTAIVPIGPDGKVHFRNNAGNLHLAIDVLGYFEAVDDDATTGRIIPLDAPFRAFDTRGAAFGNVPLGHGTQEDWSFRKFAQSVTLGDTVLDQQSALIGNLTGARFAPLADWASKTTYLSAYPGGTSRPTTSNVNVPLGENVPNMSLLTYGTSDGDPYVLQVYNNSGSIHYVLDVYAIVLK